MKHALVKLMSLNGNKARYYAYITALALRSSDKERALHLDWGGAKVAHLYIGMFNCNPRFLHLVLDAYKDSAKFEPTTSRRRVIESYHEANMSRAAATGSGLDVSILVEGPTLDEVKRKFEHLFPKAKMPNDETFRRAFRELNLAVRRGTPGRPIGSKDSDKRKRRKNSLKNCPNSVGNFKPKRP
jgi:hypothetical protein